MKRLLVPLMLLLVTAAGAPLAPGEASARTLVLPLRSVGVNDTTLFVSHDLLEGSLEDLGSKVLRTSALITALPQGAAACDDPACAAAIGAEQQVTQVVYGSLSRLGDKIIARINVLRVGETAPYYRDQLTSTTEGDLDRVMRRFAEGIAAGRPNSDRATVDSVVQEETRKPARRATRSGLGFRAGFLFPTGSSYGGSDHLTNFHFAYKYETRDFLIETTTLLGLTWNSGNVDWTILDLGASRIFGTGDFASYLGAGFGVHSVHVERNVTEWREFGGNRYQVSNSLEQSETVPSCDLIAGILAFRTFDFEIVTELRYHYVFEDFQKVNGKGARGFSLTFGTSK